MQTICAIATLAGLKICDKDVITLNISPAVEEKFIQHIAEFGHSFGTTEEYNFRLQEFAMKEAEMAEINATNGGSFTVGHNLFSTWTHEEYKAILGYKGPKGDEETNEDQVEVELEDLELPTSIDWRKKNAVNKVQNQARCGSCWSFSATAAIEGVHAIKTGNLLKLSEQQFVDCDTASYGCNGGWQKNAFIYAENHGQELEKAYPYKGTDGSCQFTKKKGKVTVQNYSTVQKKSGPALKKAIAKGPVSVTIEADKTVFQMYNGGILDSAKCGTSLDHAVAAVGYGVEKGVEYFIVRNSWGSSWGEKGYIRIATQKSGAGICGIQQISVQPTTD